MIRNSSKSSAEVTTGRILIVDSDKDVSQMIGRHFNPLGFKVDWCSSSSQLYNIDVDDYRLVIVDLDIDNGEGINLIEQVKQTSGRDNIAVIASSRRLSPTAVISALNAGADDYLLKPFSLRELQARVNAVLRRC